MGVIGAAHVSTTRMSISLASMTVCVRTCIQTLRLQMRKYNDAFMWTMNNKRLVTLREIMQQNPQSHG